MSALNLSFSSFFHVELLVINCVFAFLILKPGGEKEVLPPFLLCSVLGQVERIRWLAAFGEVAAARNR